MLHKFWENIIKNQRFGSFGNHRGWARGDPPGPQAPSRRGQEWGRAKGPPGPLVGPLAAPLAYIYLSSRNPRVQNPFLLSLLCSAAAALPRSGAPADLFPAPCRKE